MVDGNPADYDMAKLDEVLGRITHAAVDWMQDRPYDEYTFLYHLPRGPGGGGMEHAYGTAIEVSANRLRESLLPLAGISAHEFFHLWNVKRIRPQSLEPIDYQHENDTRALWFSEGVTSTVGNMLLVRAGLIDEKVYLRRVSDEITELQRRPAHRWQSAEDSSLDAWFEGDAVLSLAGAEHQLLQQGRDPGHSVGSADSPDDARRKVAARFAAVDELNTMPSSIASFPTPQGVEQAAEAVTGKSFAGVLSVTTYRGCKRFHTTTFSGWWVCMWSVRQCRLDRPGFTTTANLGGQPEVVQVDPNSDAHRAGIAAGDRVIAIDGEPADASLDDNSRRCCRERPCTFASRIEKANAM